jgi:hypothetical protein
MVQLLGIHKNVIIINNMSFLDKNFSANVSTRLTQKGRESIARGNFVISHFIVGDSEFSYVDSTTDGTIMAPFDDYGNVKYPLLYTSGSTPYGIPISGTTTEPCSNIIGPAGLVSGSYPYGETFENFRIQTDYETINSFVGNTNTLTVTNTYSNDDLITIIFNSSALDGGDITGNTNSLTYKVVSSTPTSLTLDRNIPTVLSNDIIVVNNNGEFENPVPTCTTDQRNPWKFGVVWDRLPIGLDENTTTPFIDYTTNKFVGTKEYLGYKTSSGQTTNNGTTIKNGFNDTITILPEDQKCIAILHFSEIGDMVDPDKFFKYDDHISTSDDFSRDCDDNASPLTDREYFQVHIPFLNYHRNNGTSLGATFYMDETSKTIVSSYNSKFILNYRDLIDENGIRVGKIFYNQQIIVFDDEEIAAVLDYKSNRKYTLPAPRVGEIMSIDPITELVSGKTIWVTYGLSNSNNIESNGLPCNYFMKITGSTGNNAVSIKFNTDNFPYFQTTEADFINGPTFDEFFLLVQIQPNGTQPEPHNWVKIPQTGITLTNGYISSSDIENKIFTINGSDYEAGLTGDTFNLSTHTNDDYNNSDSYFGDEKKFPGSVNVIRGTEIITMSYEITLPEGKFEYSQNPRHTDGNPIYLTEVALLNSNKDALVIGKFNTPILKTSTPILVEIDF